MSVLNMEWMDGSARVECALLLGVLYRTTVTVSRCASVSVAKRWRDGTVPQLSILDLGLWQNPVFWQINNHC